MLFFIRVVRVMVSFRSKKTLTKTVPEWQAGG